MCWRLLGSKELDSKAVAQASTVVLYPLVNACFHGVAGNADSIMVRAGRLRHWLVSGSGLSGQIIGLVVTGSTAYLSWYSGY